MRTSQLVMHWYQKTIEFVRFVALQTAKTRTDSLGESWPHEFIGTTSSSTWIYIHTAHWKINKLNWKHMLQPTCSNLIDCITGPSLQPLHDSLPLKIKRNSFFGNSTASRESTCVWHRYRRELSSPSRRAKKLNKGQSNLCHISYCWNSPTLNLKP